jgi:ribonuclease BN (tRNA processing enzyme)
LLGLSLIACRVENAPARGAGALSTDLVGAGQTRVVLLGTGTPNADPERMGPAVAIVVNGAAYLIDAGPGIVRRAAAAAQNGVDALRVENLDVVFLTHLHSDHTLGLSDLIFTPWVLERTAPLRVFGPSGTRSMTEHLLAAYEQDIHIRIDGLEPANHTGWQVDAREIAPGLVHQDENVRVTAFPVRHGSWPSAFGYRFDTADRTIVVSGDAAPSESIVEQCQGCDVLVHEVYSESGFARRPEVWQRYHAASHTSTRELAEIATRARPKLLVLYHQLFWGTAESDLVAEVSRYWNGRISSGRDLEVY